MESRHEFINFASDLPFKIFIHKIGDVAMHWHRSIELIYVVQGNVNVILGHEEYHFKSGGLLLINPNIPHSLFSEDALLIAVQIKMENLKYISESSKPTVFDCICLCEEDDDGRFAIIKKAIAKILQMNLETQHYIDCLNTALCYRLMYELFANFAVEDTRKHSIYQLSERLTTVISYINEHYSEDIALNDLAETLYFTPQYFAKFFKQNMGMTAGEYINSIRLHHALGELKNTNDSTETIGERCGFSNTRSFVDTFRKKMGVTPSVWRKNREKTSPSDTYKRDKETGYFNIDSNMLFSSVSDFLKKYSEPSASKALPKKVDSDLHLIYADIDQKGKTNHRRNLTFIGVSHIRELLLESVQNQLKEVQKKIGFKFVKSHGVFDDCMMAYSEFNGIPLYNFQCIDMAYDFLVSIGLKPMVQLSFMPSALAQNSGKTTFYNKMITSLPNDMNKWNELVYSFVSHLINRYGETEVCSWLFTIWNEPNTSEHLFGFSSEKDYFNLYKNSYDSVKSVNSNIKVGGPSAFSAYGKNNDWIYRFFDWTKNNHCTPDFLDVHYYDVDMAEPMTLKDGRRQATYLSPVLTSYYDFLTELKQKTKEKGYGDIPITISEWNSTTSHRDPISDTCFKSCSIVKNQLESIDLVDGSGYWLLTDFHSEILLNDKIFHGGLGMYTVSGIRKPAFYAYQFMSMLKKCILSRGDGYIVTKDNSGAVAILLYNYFHYSPTYATEVGINTSYTDRYSVFPDKHSKTMNIDLTLPKSKYAITQQYVNQNHGSAFDEFIRMGAIEPLSKEETELLSDISVPGYEKSVLMTEHGRLRFSTTLEPLEIRIILISPML